MFLCQHVATSLDGTDIACSGDSGAPVFIWHETDVPDAAIAGILFAGFDSQCSSAYAFSPIGGIKADLGQFDADD